MRLLVAGGAGFVGSHLAERVVAQGHEVVVVDNYLTGRPENLAKLDGHDRFTMVERDVTDSLDDLARRPERFDAVLDLASPASPDDFSRLPLEILAVGSRTQLHLCTRIDARRSSRPHREADLGRGHHSDTDR